MLFKAFFVVTFVLQGVLTKAVSQLDSGDSLTYSITIISDQDSASRIGNESVWYSTITGGLLHVNMKQKQASVEWLLSRNLTSAMNTGNRGMELSDLKKFNDQLMTVDDKTGILYRLHGASAIPWVILADGNGNSSSPFKGEWLTVRDDILYCGGYGKEVTSANGTYMNDNPMFVKKISVDGSVKHENWASKFIALREAVQIRYPGYMIHESVQWSDVHKRWFFLPRYMSELAYNKSSAHTEGANVLISTSDCFCDISVIKIGTASTTRGFSGFQFVPETNDSLIVALKSEEVPGADLKSYISVFTVDGVPLLTDSQLNGNYKYEGIEFYDLQTLKFH